jgi:CPA2 family monovalent cation:H+ antiporter-2
VIEQKYDIAGIFVGKSGFNIIEPDIWLQVLSTLGFIFLMFLSLI